MATVFAVEEHKLFTELRIDPLSEHCHVVIAYPSGLLKWTPVREADVEAVVSRYRDQRQMLDSKGGTCTYLFVITTTSKDVRPFGTRAAPVDNSCLIAELELRKHNLWQGGNVYARKSPDSTLYGEG
jgi:hypothetical protein